METETALIVVPPQASPYGANPSALMVGVKLLRLVPNRIELLVTEHKRLRVNARQPGAAVLWGLITEKSLLSCKNTKFEKFQQHSSDPWSGVLHPRGLRTIAKPHCRVCRVPHGHHWVPAA